MSNNELLLFLIDMVKLHISYFRLTPTTFYFYFPEINSLLLTYKLTVLWKVNLVSGLLGWRTEVGI